MTTKKTDPAPVKVPGMPDPGPKRYWRAKHQPNSVKTPLLLELHERLHEGGSLSTLIGKAATIANEGEIVDTANAILERAGRVNEFVGIIEGGKP